MNNYYRIITTLLIFKIVVTNAQIKEVLSPTEFEQKINSASQLIDLRTIEEYKGGHLKNASLLDIYSHDFEKLAAKLDKSKAVLMYCKAGGRSAKAMGIFASLGFKEIYDLEGGYMRWKNENKAVDGENLVEKSGLSIPKLDQYLDQYKIALLVFSAKWCVPCKKMAPILDEIILEDKILAVLKLEVDENSTLTHQYEIKSMPTILLFKNKKLIWRNEGFIEKNLLVNILYSKHLEN